MSNKMNKLKLIFLTTILIFSGKGYAQKTDTIFYDDTFVIAHYNDASEVIFYEFIIYWKDSTRKRIKYSKGQIKYKKIDGLKVAVTLYRSNAFLEKSEYYYPNGEIKSIFFNKRINKSEWLEIWSMDSTDISFYPNGQISDSLFWIRNKLVGEAKHYYENGQVAYTQRYKEGRLSKIVEYFDRDGNKLNIGSFKNGTGTWNKYDDKGNLTKIDTYKNGKLKKSKKIRTTQNESH